MHKDFTLMLSLKNRGWTARLGLSILLFWLFLSLACNYPPASQREPGLPGEALRQTLAAQGFPTDGSPTDESPTIGPSPLPSTPFPGFWGLHTATPPPGDLPLGTQAVESPPAEFTYISQPGDTLAALASRFGVEPGQIRPEQTGSEQAFINPGQTLVIPNVLGRTLDAAALLPDSEIIYSPSVKGFNLADYIHQLGGYLSTYEETVQGQTLTGVEIVEGVAVELSVNPRLLLALLEFRSGWVAGPAQGGDLRHPLGLHVPGNSGLYRELSIAATQLNVGYYGWRQGTLAELKFRDGIAARLAPQLNTGSAALQHLFSKLYKSTAWREALFGEQGFLAVYQEMFGDPWARAALVEPLFLPGMAQPELELPFAPGERWSFTGGPHASWNTGTPWGAVDFSPVTGEPACTVSRAWVRAAAPGVVTRAGDNIVAIDLDGDGHEGTGWVLFHLHVAAQDQVAPGTQVDADDPIGHPSCERGRSTGTHVHLARKYNGEWLPASGPLPFILSGWEVRMGNRIYEGTLVKGDQTVSANPGGSHTSIIIR